MMHSLGNILHFSLKLSLYSTSQHVLGTGLCTCTCTRYRIMYMYMCQAQDYVHVHVLGIGLCICTHTRHRITVHVYILGIGLCTCTIQACTCICKLYRCFEIVLWSIKQHSCTVHMKGCGLFWLQYSTSNNLLYNVWSSLFYYIYIIIYSLFWEHSFLIQYTCMYMYMYTAMTHTCIQSDEHKILASYF